MSEVVCTNARIVTADQVIEGSVLLAEGRIAAIDEGPCQVSGAIDFDGDLLIPGLIELHTDNVERHVMPRPAAPWPVAAAIIAHDREVASAGITTVFDSVSVGEVHARSGRAEMLQELCAGIAARAADGGFVADHHIHLRCELSYSGFAPMFAALIDNPLVGLVSVMDHTPGQRQFRDVGVYAQYYQGKFAMSDDEIADFIATRKEDQIHHSRANRDLVVAAARERNVAVASHDDATAEHVAEAAADGIVIAEFPTTSEAAAASRKAGMSVLMGAPNLVRGHSHSGNVSAGDLAEDNLLDILSSDYIPSSLLIGAVMLERRCEQITLPQAVRTVTLTPATRVGFDDRGEIAIGKLADLLRVRDTDEVPLIRAVWRRGEKVA